jgi:DNA-binding transcriptional LysR family regulator
MQDDLSGLRELLLVSEKRSFTAAAAELRVTPSAISQAVRTLEQRVGVRLLQRTTRSVGMTEAGARFVARLKPAFDGVREAFEAVSELRDRPAGVLRLNVPRAGYREVVAPKLRAFLTAYPDISVDVHVDEAFVDIVKQDFDAGIRLGEMLERDMIGVRLSPDLRVAVVGSPAYFASHEKPKHPRDLQAHDCINYRRRTSHEIYKWEFTQDGKDFQVAVSGRIVLDDADLLINAALDGLGIAHVMECTVQEHLASKRLIRVLDAYCIPFPGFFLYYPSRAQIAPKLQALVDFIKLERRARGGRGSKPQLPVTP